MVYITLRAARPTAALSLGALALAACADLVAPEMTTPSSDLQVTATPAPY